MNPHRIFIAVGAAVALIASPLAVSASTNAAPASLTKRCHIVKKKVHGKVKRIRVCTKPKPKPKSVSVSLDRGHQAKATLGEAGGTVTVQASGTKLTLAVPAGALADETHVTLTAVSAVRGLPKGVRFASAVQFDPEGLALAKPATMTFETSKARGARAIAWFGLGKNVSRYPSSKAGSALQIRITHFSGVGIAQGPVAAWNSVPAPIAALRDRYTSEIKPLMNRALRFDQLAGLALNEAFGFLREVELLGLGADLQKERTEIMNLVPKILQNAFDKAFERCVTGHDLRQAKKMLSVLRLAELMGIKLVGRETWFDRLEKCMRFELDFETRLTGTDEPGHLASWTIVVRAVVPIRLKPDLSGRGEAQIDYATWDYSFAIGHPACTLTGRSSGVRLGTPFQALALTIDFGEGPTDPPDIALRVFPAKPHESVTFSGCPNTPPGEDNYTIYFTSFGGLYAGQADPKGGFRIDGWSYLGEETWARRAYQRTTTFAGGFIEGNPQQTTETVSENTTFVLKHTPEG